MGAGLPSQNHAENETSCSKVNQNLAWITKQSLVGRVQLLDLSVGAQVVNFIQSSSSFQVYLDPELNTEPPNLMSQNSLNSVPGSGGKSFYLNMLLGFVYKFVLNIVLTFIPTKHEPDKQREREKLYQDIISWNFARKSTASTLLYKLLRQGKRRQL